jgi:hypothetical protein
MRTRTPVALAATYALNFVSVGYRASGEPVVFLRPEADMWVVDMCRAASAGEVLNDWRWGAIRAALTGYEWDDLTDADEWAEGTADTSAHGVLAWLAEIPARADYCERWAASTGAAQDKSLLGRAYGGQRLALAELAETIGAHLRAAVPTLNLES